MKEWLFCYLYREDIMTILFDCKASCYYDWSEAYDPSDGIIRYNN